MEYQALYRKWRPSRFDEVCGQEHVTATLKNQVRQQKVGHAYLFTGTRGTGKTSCAKILAKAVSCFTPQDGEPCGVCESCKLFETDSLYDVMEIDAASKSRVEDIRAIIDEVVYAPASGRRKVYIIDEVQMMTPSAFNALLKTLEEPPEYVVFILATTEAQKIPATILSRCQRFDFKRLSLDVITARLNFIAAHEGLSLDPAAAEQIALLADGALRDALSILEQCQTSGQITLQTVQDTVGIAGCDELLALISACGAGDTAAALQKITDFYNTSKRMDTLMNELIGCYRDILLIKMNARRTVRRGTAETEKLAQTGSALEEEYIFYCIDELSAAIAATTRNSGNLTVAQMCIIRLCRPRLSDSAAALAARMKTLEQGAGPAMPGQRTSISRLAQQTAPEPKPRGPVSVSQEPPPPWAPSPADELPPDLSGLVPAGLDDLSVGEQPPDPQEPPSGPAQDIPDVTPAAETPLIDKEPAPFEDTAPPNIPPISAESPAIPADALPSAKPKPSENPSAQPDGSCAPADAEQIYKRVCELITAPSVKAFLPQSARIEGRTLILEPENAIFYNRLSDASVKAEIENIFEQAGIPGFSLKIALKNLARQKQDGLFD